MKIQTRLFFGTAVLVLALMGLQWWLYARELRSIEEDLTGVAKIVGEGILGSRSFVFNPGGGGAATSGVWISGDEVEPVPPADPDGSVQHEGRDSEVMVVPVPPPADRPRAPGEAEVRHEVTVSDDGTVTEHMAWSLPPQQIQKGDEVKVEVESGESEGSANAATPQRLRVKVEKGDKVLERYLVVSRDDRKLQRIPIPVSPTVRRVRETMHKSVLFGAGLLAAGLVASAVLARRVSSPLRDLSTSAAALGRGELGVQVPVSAGGEVGDVLQSFNDMSRRLAELESEREQWQQREHLAQLGDLSRGLAHTLRNPLHTLGLAVEELADGGSDRSGLVATSRAQIRRIDRWLRSFLALGAGDSASPEELDLRELVEAVVLESAQQGASVKLIGDNAPVTVLGVEPALRAAVANLVENAAEASPSGEAVEVLVRATGRHVRLEIADRGPGLPDDVRDRLFHPHVTTKVGGSGMGLFLARQLVVGMHDGSLEVTDREGGGTTVAVTLPLTETDAAPESSDSG